MDYQDTTPSAPADVVSWAEVQRFFPHRKIGTYLRPLPEHNVIYVKNPKAACSTVLTWLDRLHTGEYEAIIRNIHHNHRLPTTEEVGSDTVAWMLSGAAYRFSFVRDPLGRFESVYWDKMVNDVRWRDRNAPAALGLSGDPDESVSFEQFLAAVEEQDPVSEMDPHWRPQHINLMHRVVGYDRVGRLENFDADLELIREEAGLPQVPLQARNTSTHTSSDSVYDGRPDLVRRVEQIYATDFELYGY